MTNQVTTSYPADIAGFTLIELMVTIIVLGVLVAIAAPSMQQFIVSNRLTSQANELVADISYARNEAATRGTRITMCISSDGATCTGTDWQAGRMIFVDTNVNGTWDAGEPTLKITQALDTSATLVATGFPNAYLQFRPYGGLQPAIGGSFKLCSSSSATGRQITVAVTGRPTANRVTCT